MQTIELTLNGERARVAVEPHETLLAVLRQRLAATEVKSGCERGDCGACAVIVDGKAINSCLALAVQAEGKVVLTVRGLGTPEAPHPLQRAFVELGAAQCGTFGSQAVEVEVDETTGEVEVRRLASCYDVGKATNRNSVEGQIEGGAPPGR
jgi:aerobic-type carbon monoxide dehydrogenase small subunit (CoxS/CutS family)